MKLSKVSKLKAIYKYGNYILESEVYSNASKLTEIEAQKTPFRYDIINYLLNKTGDKNNNYLEIGVRNPIENFDKIICQNKYSVDPGIEFEENPVDFKVTSDVFFAQLEKDEVLTSSIKFDVIFIDGLHLADQVERDIHNSLKYLKEDGFIVLHDCNPPTEHHARESHSFRISPAWSTWNGTVWKSIYKMRLNKDVSVCCVDSDWGVGIISKKTLFPVLETDINPFYEYSIFDKNRVKSLNLISFEEFCEVIDRFKVD